jgi:hypothetical protein
MVDKITIVEKSVLGDRISRIEDESVARLNHGGTLCLSPAVPPSAVSVGVMKSSFAPSYRRRLPVKTNAGSAAPSLLE